MRSILCLFWRRWIVWRRAWAIPIFVHGRTMISNEGNYCTYYIAEYSDSGVYLEAQSKKNYELTYKDSVYTENFEGMDYRLIDFAWKEVIGGAGR